MKRNHKVLFENLLQEEYNRGYDDCKKTVMQNLRVKAQKEKTPKTHTLKDTTHHTLLSVMRENPLSLSVKEWTQLINKTNNSSLSEGTISGALDKMKMERLVTFGESGWQIRYF